MGSRVSRPTGRTSFSVISAKARAALRWRSTLSEKERVVRAERGEPAKKLVAVRSGKMCISISVPQKDGWQRTLKVLEQIRDRLPLVLKQKGFV